MFIYLITHNNIYAAVGYRQALHRFFEKMKVVMRIFIVNPIRPCLRVDTGNCLHFARYSIANAAASASQVKPFCLRKVMMSIATKGLNDCDSLSLAKSRAPSRCVQLDVLYRLNHHFTFGAERGERKPTNSSKYSAVDDRLNDRALRSIPSE